MKLRLKNFEEILVFITVFLFPSQLALHFWPQSAFVFGIRVDFLAPAIYLTDILIGFLLALWFFNAKSKILAILKKYAVYLLALFIFAFVNTLFSASVYTSLFRWLKIFEYVFLFGYFSFRGLSLFLSKIKLSIFLSLIFFGFIGFLQFFLQRAIGGPLYFLGERFFNASTPGIALVNMSGLGFMRAYSTFSHPNSLAGYFAAALLYLLSVGYFKVSKVHSLGFLFIVLVVCLSFSISAVFALFLCLAIFIFARHISRSFIYIATLLLALIPLVFILFLNPEIGSFLGKTVSERAMLSQVSLKMIGAKPFLGLGLGNFVTTLPLFSTSSISSWILQPVHNIFLLVFSEMGVVGFLALLALFAFGLESELFLVIVFICLTGSLDHYWITLQQNSLLLVLMLSLVFFFRKRDSLSTKKSVY